MHDGALGFKPLLRMGGHHKLAVQAICGAPTVTRHAILLNPALSVLGKRYAVVEGKTPEITVAHARTLLASINTSHLVGLRRFPASAIEMHDAASAKNNTLTALRKQKTPTPRKCLLLTTVSERRSRGLHALRDA